MSGVDPTLARLALAVGALTGVGAIAYVVAWIVVPEEDPAAGKVIRPASPSLARGIRIGLAVLGVLGGMRLLGGLWFPFGWWDDRPFGWHGPGVGGLLGLSLLAAGLAVLLRRRPWDNVAAASPPGGVAAPPAPGAGADVPPTMPVPAGPWDAPVPPAPTNPRDVALTLARVVGWLAVLWFGGSLVAGTVMWGFGALRVRLPLLLGVVVVAAFVGLLAALVRGKRASTIFGAVGALTIPLALALALVRWDGGVGSRTVRPRLAAEVLPAYEHAVGEFELDLSDVDLPPGPTRVAARLHVGELRVIVPWDATVTVRSEGDAGSLEVLGRNDSGLGLTQQVHDAGEAGAPQIELDLDLGLGHVLVSREFTPETKAALDARTEVAMFCERGEAPTTRHCTTPDGYPTPELVCAVTGDGYALCRPPGQSTPALRELLAQPGSQRCQVPPNGGAATCDPPAATPQSGPTPTASPVPPATIELVCETDPNGQPINCQPKG
jgi:hypothetical protein